jgi:lipopolysaccharide transport system permease protein
MCESEASPDAPNSSASFVLTGAVSRGLHKARRVIQPKTGWAALEIRELWDYRDLLWVLIEREIKLRYKQTLLGVIWVVLQPLIAALIFAVVLGRFAKLPSDDLPYLLFVFGGLVAWNFFAGAIQRGSNSLVLNSQLISKVYFPRLILPVANTLAVFVDFAVMLAVLIVLMFAYRDRLTLTLQVLALPLFVMLLIVTAIGVALWLSALSVKYRDFMYAAPFLIQVWMYASPVIYPIRVIPDQWKMLYCLNPTAGLIEGFRWSLFGRGTMTLQILVITIAMSLLIALSGAIFFRRVERSFADVI